LLVVYEMNRTQTGSSWRLRPPEKKRIKKR